MIFSLNHNSGVPIYRQLHQQLRERILSGQLPPDTQLPSVRDLASEIKVNPLTISKVYQMLERDGLTESRRGLGTYVKAHSFKLQPHQQARQLEPALKQLVAEALHLGMAQEDVHDLLKETFQQLKKGTE